MNVFTVEMNVIYNGCFIDGFFLGCVDIVKKESINETTKYAG